MIGRTCPQGHRIPGDTKVCPTCGWGAKKASPVPEGVRPAYRKGYRTAEYRANRTKRLALSEGRCERCGRPVMAGQYECHHMIALRDGGTDALENLRILCTVPPNDCHRAVTREIRRARRRA